MLTNAHTSASRGAAVRVPRRRLLLRNTTIVRLLLRTDVNPIIQVAEKERVVELRGNVQGLVFYSGIAADLLNVAIPVLCLALMSSKVATDETKTGRPPACCVIVVEFCDQSALVPQNVGNASSLLGFHHRISLMLPTTLGRGFWLQRLCPHCGLLALLRYKDTHPKEFALGQPL